MGPRVQFGHSLSIVSHLSNLQVVVGFKNLSQRLSLDPKYNGLMEMRLELKNKQWEDEFFDFVE